MWGACIVLPLAAFHISLARAADPTSAGIPPQTSPTWLSDVHPVGGSIQSYPNGQTPTGPLPPPAQVVLQGYPQAWTPAFTNTTEVQAAIKAIDWTTVPDAPVRKEGAAGIVAYDSVNDPDCWWTAGGCTHPKRPNVPPDVSFCPTAGAWGLTYDDGPLTEEAGASAEPNLYDFLAKSNQKSTLFYIGSNVVTAPTAAQRGLADGHTICSHTWSHPAMTSKTNEEVVAELYWSLRAIKEVTGVTTKCWRPPFGDVDDRVRAIAWQMGLMTIVWDRDTNDWNMPGIGGGNLAPATVDGYFNDWIQARKNGSDNQQGHIVLQHELNNATVDMAEKWLPSLQQVFQVMPIHQCLNISTPYWETNFVYPTLNGATGPSPLNPPSSSTQSTSSVNPKGGASSSDASKLHPSIICVVAIMCIFMLSQ